MYDYHTGKYMLPTARISENTSSPKWLPCPPLQAHLSSTIAQHGVEAERRLCDLGLAPKRNAALIHTRPHTLIHHPYKMCSGLYLHKVAKGHIQASTNHLCTMLDMEFHVHSF
jgi:hypothetical protein